MNVEFLLLTIKKFYFNYFILDLNIIIFFFVILALIKSDNLIMLVRPKVILCVYQFFFLNPLLNYLVEQYF